MSSPAIIRHPSSHPFPLETARNLILIQPDSLSTTLGEVVTFSVLAKGFPVPAYQWSKDSTPIAGATNSSLLIAAVTATDYGSYSVTVKNSVGSSTSQPAVLGGNPVAPSIIKQPVSQTINKGDSTSLSVSADGTSPLQFQWRKDGQNLPQATNSTLVITDAKLSDAGYYQVTVTNPYGSVASDVISLDFRPLEIPRLATTYANGVVKLLIPARTTPMRVEESQDLAAWARIESIPLTGIEVIVDVYDRGTVGSTAFNDFFRLVPDVANATQLPRIIGQPPSIIINPGEPFQLSVTANGSGAMAYQWYRNGASIPNEIKSTMTIASATTNDTATYYVIVGNVAGSVKSQEANVKVISGTAPRLKRSFAFISFYYNKGTPFTVEIVQHIVNGQLAFSDFVDGTGPFTFIWYRDGIQIGTSTVPEFKTTAISGVYSVLVKNAFGSLTIRIGQVM